ncbi:MAG: TonB-dependent receptor, partial [Myxococcota bacterium]
WHGVVGVRVRPAGWLEGEVAAFLLEHRNLAVRDDDPTPPVASLLTSAGRGQSRGVQATVAGSRHGISGRVAYTWLRARRQGPREAERPRPFDREQPHSLQASLVGEHPSGWSLGSRLEVASGAPRTPVNGAVFDARGQRFDPVFGPQNSDRLPVFLALSARAALTLYPRRSQLKLWLDVQNVTNRKNVEELYYNADYSQRSAILGLPILAVMGVEARL